jgi:hypothetical protein
VTVSLAAFPLFALFKPVGTIVLLLPGSPYLAALFLLLSALHLLLVAPTHPAMRWIAGAVLLLLSFWVNVSNIAIATVGIALWPATEKVSLKSRLGCLALAVVSALALIAIAERFPGAGFRQMQPVGLWPGSLLRILGNVTTFLHVTAAAVIVAMAVLVEALRPRGWKYSPVHALLIGAVCQIGATAASEWVARNGFDARYIAGPVFVVLASAVLSLVKPAAGALERVSGRPAAVLVACLLSVVIATRIFGVPSAGAALAHIDRATSDVPPPPDQLSCTHIIGNYWYVWETVFHDRLRTGQQRIWGVTHRADVTRDAWTSMPVARRRYCGLCSDSQIEYMRAVEHVGPLQKTSESSDICVFRELTQ